MNLSQNFKGSYGTMYYTHDMKNNLTPDAESDTWSSFQFGDHRICLHAAEPGLFEHKG